MRKCRNASAQYATIYMIRANHASDHQIAKRRMNVRNTAICLGACMLTFAAVAANVYVDDDNFGSPA